MKNTLTNAEYAGLDSALNRGGMLVGSRRLATLKVLVEVREGSEI